MSSATEAARGGKLTMIMGAGMSPQSLLSEFWQSAVADRSRSTALKPLGWLGTLLAFSLLAAIRIGAPTWVLWVCGGGLALTVLLYIAAFIYLLFKDRDALRSEKYSIQKLAIEKGLVGDSTRGLLDPDAVLHVRQLPSDIGRERERPE